jgi:ubiquinone biosynthesis protein UbiJ
MARMIAEVYDALRSAGADEDKARAAATAIAGQWDIEPRFDRIDRRFDQIDERIDKVEQRLDRLEGRFDRFEDRFDRLEQRVGRLETDIGIIKWIARLHSRVSACDLVLHLAADAAPAGLRQS